MKLIVSFLNSENLFKRKKEIFLRGLNKKLSLEKSLINVSVTNINKKISKNLFQ